MSGSAVLLEVPLGATQIPFYPHHVVHQRGRLSPQGVTALCFFFRILLLSAVGRASPLSVTYHHLVFTYPLPGPLRYQWRNYIPSRYLLVQVIP